MNSPETILNEVRRNHLAFEATLFRRDAIEVSVAAGLVLVFGYGAYQMRQWGLGVCAAGCLFVGAFFVVDRWLHRRRHRTEEGSLKQSVQVSMAQVEHQIWLLKNVVWWYILPPSIGMFAFFGSLAWQMRDAGLFAFAVMGGMTLPCLLVNWVVYRLNQQAIEKVLKPRREELGKLLASLEQTP